MGRTRWMAAGVAVGVGGTLWVEQRVRRRIQQAVDRLAPSALSQGVASGAQQVSDRIRSAVEVGRSERARHEAELRQRYGGQAPSERAPSGAVTDAGRPTTVASEGRVTRHARGARVRGRRHEQARR